MVQRSSRRTRGESTTEVKTGEDVKEQNEYDGLFPGESWIWQLGGQNQEQF